MEGNPDLPKEVPNPKSKVDLDRLLPNPGKDGYTFFENASGHPLVPSVEFQHVNAWWLIDMAYCRTPPMSNTLWSSFAQFTWKARRLGSTGRSRRTYLWRTVTRW